MRLPIRPTKEQVTYFATPNVKEFSPSNFPVFIHYWKTGENTYGIPVFGVMGTKAGLHDAGKVVDPDTRTFEPDVETRDKLVTCLQKAMPDFLGPVMYTKTCLYANTPDEDFILDSLPDHPHVFVFVGAGHSYKWASFMGLALSQLALTGKSSYDLDGFKLRKGVSIERIPSGAKL